MVRRDFALAFLFRTDFVSVFPAPVRMGILESLQAMVSGMEPEPGCSPDSDLEHRTDSDLEHRTDSDLAGLPDPAGLPGLAD